MATRSSVGYETESGGCIAVYCHYDGFPDHMAPILNNLTYDEVKDMVETALVEGGLRGINDDGTYETFQEQSDSFQWRYDTAFANINGTDYAYLKRKDGSLFISDFQGREIT